MITGIFTSVLRATAAGSVLLILVILAQWALQKKLSPRWRYALWLLVVVRLALPISIESELSLFNWVRLHPSTEATTGRKSKSGNSKQTEALSTAKVSPAPPTAAVAAPFDAASEPSQVVPAPPARPSVIVENSSKTVALKMRTFSWRELAAWLWAAGALAMTGYFASSTLRFSSRIRNSETVEDPELIDVLRACANKMGVRRTPKLILTDAVSTPAVYGLVRPSLLLPRELLGGLTIEQLRYVFLHELAHVKRRDLWMNWFLAGLQVLHWFNPLVWVAFRRMHADRELACDAMALNCAGEAESRSYGETILKLLESLSGGIARPGLVGIIEDEQAIKRRITCIANFRRSSGWSLAAASIAIMLAFVCLTDAQTDGSKRRAGEVEGTALNPDGSPAKDATVALVVGNSWKDTWFVEDAQGRPSRTGERIDVVQADRNGRFVFPKTERANKVFVLADSGCNWASVETLASNRTVQLKPWIVFGDARQKLSSEALVDDLDVTTPLVNEWLFHVQTEAIPLKFRVPGRAEKPFEQICDESRKILIKRGTNAWPVIPKLVENLFKTNREFWMGYRQSAGVLAGIHAESSPYWQMIQGKLANRSEPVEALALLLTNGPDFSAKVNIDAQRFALRALAAVGPPIADSHPAAFKELLRLIDSDQFVSVMADESRLLAFAAVGATRSAGSNAVPVLEKFLNDSREYAPVRVAAGVALARIQPANTNVVGLFRHWIRIDEGALMRVNAAEGLRQLGVDPQEYLGVLTNIAIHANLVSARCMALQTLGKLGPKAIAAKASIEEVTRDSNQQIREAAAKALKAIDPAADAPEATLRIPTKSVVTGVVINAEGKPEKGATAVLVCGNPWRDSPWHLENSEGKLDARGEKLVVTQTDVNGRFTFPETMRPNQVFALGASGCAWARAEALKTDSQMRLTAWIDYDTPPESMSLETLVDRLSVSYSEIYGWLYALRDDESIPLAYRSRGKPDSPLWSPHEAARLELIKRGTNSWPVIPKLVDTITKPARSTTHWYRIEAFEAATALARIRAEQSQYWPLIQQRLADRTEAVNPIAALLALRNPYNNDSADPVLQRFALRALAAIGPPTGNTNQMAMGQLLVLIHSDSEELRNLSFAAIGAMRTGGSNAVPVLEKMLTDASEYPNVRVPAGVALARIQPTNEIVLKVLREGLRDERGVMRVQSAEGLRQLGVDSGEYFPVLTDALSHKLVSVRCAALKTLGELGNQANSARPLIEKLIHDDDGKIREAAAKALQRLGN